MGAPVGNNNAARGNQLRGKLRAILSKLDDKEGKYDGATEEEILTAYVNEARSNADIRRDFLDRMWGKPAQAVSVDGDGEGGPILQRIERVLVRASTSDTDSGSI